MTADPVERRNGALFLWANLLYYFGAPVFYVGVVQAALCNKLGASATVANLPATTNALGAVAPFVIACLIPYRWEQRAVVATAVLTALQVLLTGLTLVVPLAGGVRVAAVVFQGLCLGLLHSSWQVYMYQCLGRGTTEAGRARVLQLTYAVGPMFAVAGSLTAQFILRGGLPVLAFPRDFAALQFIALPCAVGMAWCGAHFELVPIAEEARPPILHRVRGSFHRFTRSRTLTLLWLAYLLWYAALMAGPNLSLYTKPATGRPPSDFSGVILAIWFGSKAVFGFLLGMLNIRFGYRAPLIAVVSMFISAMFWAWGVPGTAFLFAFGFMGAGELGGVYFPNAVLSRSPSATSAQDLAFLAVVMAVAGVFPALYGFITDHWGFPAAFALGGAAGFGALCLVLRLPARAEESAA